MTAFFADVYAGVCVCVREISSNSIFEAKVLGLNQQQNQKLEKF